VILSWVLGGSYHVLRGFLHAFADTYSAKLFREPNPIFRSLTINLRSYHYGSLVEVRNDRQTLGISFEVAEAEPNSRKPRADAYLEK
jgi:hypothetical protein